MGTNFYWHRGDPCESCHREWPEKHIGKSSAGWCFALQVYPEEGIHDLADWETLWATPGSYITNEYGDREPVAGMLHIISVRKWKRDGQDLWSLARENDALIGPNGLLRHRVDNRHCIGHGAGTWDLMAGEFS